jgi:F-type H+-transporting ATPase subunit a
MIVLLVVIGGLFGVGLAPPVTPIIQLPGEVFLRFPRGSFLINWFGAGLTNTFMSTLVVFTLLILLPVFLRARSRNAEDVPSGFYNFFEMIIELAFGYVENAAGKWARPFFHFFMTFILWVLVANWMGLVPGMDSIGIMEYVPHAKAIKDVDKELADGKLENNEEAIKDREHELEESYREGGFVTYEESSVPPYGIRWGGIFVMAPDGWLVANQTAHSPEEANEEHTNEPNWHIIPFLRPAATDLNFTVAIAIISVIMTQVYGMRAQGLAYWKKFFNWPAERMSEDPLAIIDPIVGLLEFISEVFKIVSFAFRLVGNIFAGMVLLFVIAGLFATANLLFYHLEFGVGILQALIFALLTLTFMSGATESHHGEEDHH